MAPGMGGSLYEVLRVEPTAMISEIKTVYRSFAKVYHHDLSGNGWDYTEIHNAYETLSDPKARAVYDMSLKKKFGHHGGNHPVHNIQNGRVEISAQNHNYAVDPATLPKGVEVTHINLNDGTCAGLAYPALNVMSLQYHLEASPGPDDSDCVFRDFVELMKSVKYRA
ncbi:hypothetical protein KPL70_026317 [Citrus sinensis]|uniref:J domain-containing protein n=3 Tax=Citrus TaxID=2706 RepID=V4S9Z9_CITCL|nr:hypothetical protein CICLE_v10006484mg [Citrus x clementina]KAH9650287.1 hypothetical protein KPL70_026317 [Citrus sinensis]